MTHRQEEVSKDSTSIAKISNDSTRAGMNIKKSKPTGKNFIVWQTVERISKIAHRHEGISKNSKRTGKNMK